MTYIARQGDVLIISVPSVPETAKPVARENGRVVLAHGELTCHAHAIKDSRATLFSDPKLNAMFLEVSGSAPVALRHDEYSTIDVPPGNYKVVRLREYTPEAIRRVLD